MKAQQRAPSPSPGRASAASPAAAEGPGNRFANDQLGPAVGEQPSSLLSEEEFGGGRGNLLDDVSSWASGLVGGGDAPAAATPSPTPAPASPAPGPAAPTPGAEAPQTTPQPPGQGPSAPAGPTPPAPAPATRPTGPLRLAWNTESGIASPRRVGVGETCNISCVTDGATGGTWSATGGVSTPDGDGMGTTWSAPAEPGRYTITFESGGHTASVTLNVVKPAAIHAEKLREETYLAGQQGVQMYLRLSLAPMAGVSWSGIEFKELSGDGQGSGYWGGGDAAAIRHNASDAWSPGNGTIEDTAGISGQPNSGEHAWQHGELHWQVPYVYHLASGGEALPIAHAPYPQTFIMEDATGTTSVSKHGFRARRHP